MKLGIIIVCFDNKVDSTILFKQIISQKSSSDKLLVIDNNPNHLNYQKYSKLSGIDHIIKNQNTGFGSACNLGADKIKNDVDAFLFLNPDTRITKDLLDKYKAVNHRYDAYMANLLIDNNKINNDGSVVHISGLSWSGNYLKEYTHHSQDKYKEINYVSGACLFIWKDTFYDIGQFYEEYFLYYEDTDLSSRLKLSGKKMALITDAVVYHYYVSNISKIKYYYIQKNRIVYMLINWPVSILILLSPIIIFFEFALITHSIIDNKLNLKMKSYIIILKDLKSILNNRKKTMKMKKIKSSEYLRLISPTLDSGLIENFFAKEFINRICNIYYKYLLKILN